MADVQLTDIIEPQVFADYTAVHSPEKTAFAESGIAVTNAMLDAKAKTGGTIYDLPFWKDLDATDEPNLSSDSDDLAVPAKATTDKQISRTAYLNNAWAAKDLVSEIAGSDPMQHIRSRTDFWWTRQWQRRLLAVSDGLLAENQAGSGDMTVDISIDDGNAATDANLIGRSAVVEACFTMGDGFEGIGTIVMHSVPYQRLVELDDIEFIKDSEGTLTIPTYLGKRVVTDDGMTAVAGATSGVVYTTVLFGSAAMGYGMGAPRVPVEVEREALKGDGGGLETLVLRKTWLIHPLGYKFNSATVTGESASLAELKIAANWTRVLERKSVPIAFLVTNG